MYTVEMYVYATPLAKTKGAVVTNLYDCDPYLDHSAIFKVKERNQPHAIYKTSVTSSTCPGSTITLSITCSVALNGNPTTLSNVPSIFSTRILPIP